MPGAGAGDELVAADDEAAVQARCRHAEFGRFGAGHGIRKRNDAKLLAFLTNQTDLSGIDFAVDPRCFFLGYCEISVSSKKQTVPPAARRG